MGDDMHFDNPEDLRAYLAGLEERYPPVIRPSRVEPHTPVEEWQRAAGPGRYGVIFTYPAWCYLKMIEPREPLAANCVLAHIYSLYSNGYLEETHLSRLDGFLSRVEFKRAQVLGWPQCHKTFTQILSFRKPVAIQLFQGDRPLLREKSPLYLVAEEGRWNIINEKLMIDLYGRDEVTLVQNWIFVEPDLLGIALGRSDPEEEKLGLVWHERLRHRQQ